MVSTTDTNLKISINSKMKMETASLMYFSSMTQKTPVMNQNLIILRVFGISLSDVKLAAHAPLNQVKIERMHYTKFKKRFLMILKLTITSRNKSKNYLMTKMKKTIRMSSNGG